MDSLFQLIQSGIEQTVSKQNVLRSVPCKVVEVLNNGVKVQLLSDETEYTVANYSGSEINVGEVVQLYYRGNYILQHTAYIGASENKGGIAKFNCIKGTYQTGEIFDTDRTIATIGYTVKNDLPVFLQCNFVVYDNIEGMCNLKIYINGELYYFEPKQTIIYGHATTISFSVPIFDNIANNVIEIKAYGIGNVLSADCFVYGFDIALYEPYTPTTDSDYIYTTHDGVTDVIYYVGDATKPSIPTTINNAPTNKLYATSFNYSDVEMVYIPEGIEEIE